MSLGNKVKKLRETMNITQAKLAKAADCDQSFISKLEKGHTLSSLTMLQKLATALGVSVADLLDDTQAAGLDKTGTE